MLISIFLFCEFLLKSSAHFLLGCSNFSYWFIGDFSGQHIHVHTRDSLCTAKGCLSKDTCSRSIHFINLCVVQMQGLILVQRGRVCYSKITRGCAQLAITMCTLGKANPEPSAEPWASPKSLLSPASNLKGSIPTSA